MSSRSFSNNNQSRRGLIWLRDPDPDGYPLNPAVKEVAYRKEPEILAYRAEQMRDDAEAANLLEQAAYKTSRAANKTDLKDPAAYLYITYANLVDSTLRRTIQSLGLEPHVLDVLASSSPETEQDLIKKLTRQEIIALMDEKDRELWELLLFGYDTGHLAAQTGQDVCYVGKRLRRALERALRRLLEKKVPVDDSSVSENKNVRFETCSSRRP
jgi:predicted AAA+ superfamily ATPase